MFKDYHNTTHENEQLCFDFNKINQVGNLEILAVFEASPNQEFTPYQVADELSNKGNKMLQSSVKRGITDLTKAGKLINTGKKVIERYGRPNYTWILNTL